MYVFLAFDEEHPFTRGDRLTNTIKTVELCWASRIAGLAEPFVRAAIDKPSIVVSVSGTFGIIVEIGQAELECGHNGFRFTAGMAVGQRLPLDRTQAQRWVAVLVGRALSDRSSVAVGANAEPLFLEGME